MIDDITEYEEAKNLTMSQVGLKKHYDDLQQALLQYRREHNIFEKSDFITGTWGLEKRVFQIILKPKLKSGVLYLTVNIDGIKKEILAQWMRHATPEEIQAGKRL